MLAAESAAVRRQPDTQAQARETASALLASPCVVQARVLSALRLNALYLNSSGAAYVDLSAAASGQEGTGSAWDEILAVYAIVNTLTQNFEDIKRVHILVNGKETQTLAGHIDMSPFFSRRMDLVKQ
jgi:spore germination protein GerM